jgi:transketolase
MRVLVPADYNAAKAAIRCAAQTPGPFYVRLGRAALPEVYPEGTEWTLGKANVLRKGKDVTLVACGVMVAEALAAAKRLDRDGVSAEAIVESAKKTGHVVTCEEHSIIGGLGSAVAEVLGENAPVPLKRIGVEDRFGTSGEPDELMGYFRLTAADIREAVEDLLAR